MATSPLESAELLAIHPSLALAAYGEELCRGGRIAVFGDASLSLAEELLSRGARLVHVYDTEPARVAEATARPHDRSIFYAALPESGDIGVRDGTFDVVFVPDLTFAAEPASLIALTERILTSAGAAIIASPNGETENPLLPVTPTRPPLGYYELYDVVSAHFSQVRMLGQAPFVGYAIAEFAADDPDPTIDTSLADAEGKDADWFIALASHREVRLDAFSLVELPMGAALDEIPALPREAALAPPADYSESAGTVLVDVVDAEREAALEALRQQEQTAKEERFRADQATQQLGAAREEVALLRERCQTLQKGLEDEEARRSASEVELERVRHNPEWATLRERVQTLEDSSKHTTEDNEREVSRLEAQLRERGQQLMALEAEVVRREKLVRELVATAVPAPANGTPDVQDGTVSDLSARLDRMAGEAAQREADLVAARWRIAQLERERTQER
ncbi:MAG TPA: hypothetical protein VGL13_14680 [Polyangiaceae bacterium]|jgi:hypothetical protein